MIRDWHTKQQLAWTGTFDCAECYGEGEDGKGRECSECEGTGEIQLDCILKFDIMPGIEPTGMSGPPENYDPGCGPEIRNLVVRDPDDTEDWTEDCLTIASAEEYIADKWMPPEPDYPDHEEG